MVKIGTLLPSSRTPWYMIPAPVRELGWESFQRVDTFEGHLTGVHAVDQALLNRWRKKTSRHPSSGNTNSMEEHTGYPLDAISRCSTCSGRFLNAQGFYEHLRDCALRLVQRGDLSEAVDSESRGMGWGGIGFMEP
jgi:hypothetical protein